MKYKITTLNYAQLERSLRQYRYVAIRFSDELEVAVNCKIYPIFKRNNKKHGAKKSNVISYRPIGFQEYISNKTPFI